MTTIESKVELLQQNLKKRYPNDTFIFACKNYNLITFTCLSRNELIYIDIASDIYLITSRSDMSAAKYYNSFDDLIMFANEQEVQKLY